MESIKVFIKQKETEKLERIKKEQEQEQIIAEKSEEWRKTHPMPAIKKCKHGNPINSYSCRYHSEIWHTFEGFYWREEELLCELCKQEIIAGKLLENAHIPGRFADVPADNCVPQGSVMWSGGVGTGKTYKLVATMKALINEGAEVRFINWGSLVRKIRDSIQNGEYNDLYNGLLRQEYIVIDDFGTENTTDFICEFVYNLINDVYNSGSEQKLLITTNLTGTALVQKYGDRTVSRLTEMCEIVKMVGDDRRLQR